MAYVLFGAAGSATAAGAPPEWAFSAAAFMYLVGVAAGLVKPILAYRERVRETDRFYDLEEEKLRVRYMKKKEKMQKGQTENES